MNLKIRKKKQVMAKWANCIYQLGIQHDLIAELQQELTAHSNAPKAQKDEKVNQPHLC